jgi:hypothetical protein
MANGSAVVFLAELVHPAGGIDDLLFAGVEGMAGGADLHVKFVLSQGGTGDELVAAAAYDLNILVVRMNIRFHDRLALKEVTVNPLTTGKRESAEYYDTLGSLARPPRSCV